MAICLGVQGWKFYWVKMEILLEGSLDLQLDTNINSFVKMFLAWFTMSWPAAV